MQGGQFVPQRIELSDMLSQLRHLRGQLAALPAQIIQFCLNARGAFGYISAFRPAAGQCCQAMPQGGLLELIAYQRDGNVCLDVIDTGSGIDPQQQRRIFEAFYSTKPNGSGLGLPTVKRIIEAHGGTIECQSEKGRGSRFTICLPAA